jgi:UDP-galactopyranose mutase
MYDYLIIGAGLYGSIFAYEMTKLGKKCLVIDRRTHIGGNCYTESVSGIQVHRYGPHIFNTNNEFIWNYINGIYPFNPYYHNVKLNYNGRLYTFPINLNTFNELWGVCEPLEVEALLSTKRKSYDNIDNLESWVCSQLGEEIFNIFYKGYSEKQWGVSCDKIPCNISARIPIRYNFNNNYHNSIYSGIPLNGNYTAIFEKLLDGIEVKLGESFNKDNWRSLGKMLIYSGSIDEYYDYKYGELEYRSLRFDSIERSVDNYQGIAQVNFGNIEIPYTRLIEHKWFNYKKSGSTILTYEYPDSWSLGKERYYPINNEKNKNLYKLYNEESKKDNDIIFGGRLGSYKYFDMDQVVGQALNDVIKVSSY